jgi:hypothetical protein
MFIRFFDYLMLNYRDFRRFSHVWTHLEAPGTQGNTRGAMPDIPPSLEAPGSQGNTRGAMPDIPPSYWYVYSLF